MEGSAVRGRGHGWERRSSGGRDAGLRPYSIRVATKPTLPNLPAAIEQDSPNCATRKR